MQHAHLRRVPPLSTIWRSRLMPYSNSLSEFPSPVPKVHKGAAHHTLTSSSPSPSHWTCAEWHRSMARIDRRPPQQPGLRLTRTDATRARWWPHPRRIACPANAVLTSCTFLLPWAPAATGIQPAALHVPKPCQRVCAARCTSRSLPGTACTGSEAQPQKHLMPKGAHTDAPQAA